MQNVKKILKGNRVDGMFHSHVSMGKKLNGKFAFNRQTLEEFYEHYQSAIRETDEQGNMLNSLYIAEKSQEYLPVLGDIDLKCVTEDGALKHLYSKFMVKFIIETYQKVINEIVSDVTSEDLNCVFLAKEPYTITSGEQTYIKHGFHLHFPSVFIDKNTQRNHLFPRIKEFVSASKLFQNLGYDDSGDTIDDCPCKNPWLMYGSRKDEQHKPYLVKYVFNSKLEKITLEDAFKNYKIYDNREHLINIEGKVEEYLPRILSIVPYGRKTKEVKPSLVKYNEKKNEERNTRKERTEQADPDSTLETAQLLLNMLSEVRAEKYDDWTTIAWILHRTFEGSIEARDLWKEWAGNCSDKFNEEEHDTFWDRIQDRDDGVTMGTLRHYASIDNPKAYKSFKTTKCKKFLTLALEGSHQDLARAFHSIEGDYVKIVDDDNCYMWSSEKSLWRHKKCSRLLSIISDTLTPKYYEIVKGIYEEMKEDPDKSKEALSNAKIKQVQKIIQCLKNASYLKAILSLYVAEYRDDDIESRMNSEKYITPIKHGKVIDLRTSEVRTRENTDLFSFECPVKIVSDTSVAMRFLDSLSGGQKDHTEYLIRLCGYFMTGDVSHRGFYISWGVGRNGKSSLVNILKEILGKFFVSISEDVFIKKDKAGGGATPELMPLIGARFAVLSETDEKEKLNSKRIKSLTGSDTISARALYKDQINFVPHCKIMMLTNVKPEFDADDQALIDRLNFIPFPARFNKNRENTKYIESLTTDYLDQFFTLFCQGAKQWSEDGEMMDSKISIDGKIKYQQENDTLRDFITGHTVDLRNAVGEEKGQTIPSKDLFNAYKSYCSENDIRPITVQKFSSRVENEFYKKDIVKKIHVFTNCRFINGSDMPQTESSEINVPNPLL